MAADNRFVTGKTIVDRALRSIGLPVPTSASGATDTLSVQIWALLTELGQELLDAHQWSLRGPLIHEFVTTPPELIYQLPTDFNRYIDVTGWDVANRLPLQGPLTAQEFAYIKARNLASTAYAIQWTIGSGQIQFTYVPATPSTIRILYQGRHWVRDGSNSNLYKDTIENDDDVCLYDPRLMVAMLRFRWRQAKGFNTTDLEQQYLKALENAKNADSPGRDLYIAATRRHPYIGDSWISVAGGGGTCPPAPSPGPSPPPGPGPSPPPGPSPSPPPSGGSSFTSGSFDTPDTFDT